MRRESLKTLALATRGIGHRKSGTPCQDAVAWIHTDSGSGICLSDGAGSKPLSHVGSGIAVVEALNLVAARFRLFLANPESVAPAILNHLMPLFRAAADDLAEPVSGLASTLLFAFAHVSKRRVHYLCGNLGDGVIGIRRRCGMEVLLPPENGEYANQAWFVTSPDACEHFRVVAGSVASDELPGWFLGSDGSASCLYGQRSGRFAPAVLSLLEDVRTCSAHRARTLAADVLEHAVIPRTDDDCSIGLLQTGVRRRHVPKGALI